MTCSYSSVIIGSFLCLTLHHLMNIQTIICPQHRTNTNELLMRGPDVNTQYLKLSVSRCRSQLDWMRISNNHSCSDSVLTQSSQSRLLLCNETFRSMQKDIMGNIDAHYLVVVQYARILSPT